MARMNWEVMKMAKGMTAKLITWVCLQMVAVGSAHLVPGHPLWQATDCVDVFDHPYPCYQLGVAADIN